MKTKGILTVLVLFLGVALYAQNFTSNASVTTSNDPVLTLNENGNTSFTEIMDRTNGLTQIRKYGASGSVYIDVEPVALDGSSSAQFRFFRYNGSGATTGNTSFIIFKGDGTFTPNAQISGRGDTYFCANNGRALFGSRNYTNVSADAVLAVNGKMESEEIQVKATVADYVFKDDYDLMNLESLEEYINTNGYLPNIQNDQDVEENNGFVNVGDLSISLMEKMEELTLHLIEMNKRVNALEVENKELKSKINSEDK